MTASLATLEQTAPLDLDLAVRARNLAALEAFDPPVAADLSGCEPPAGWQPTRALDGFATWRWTRTGEPRPEWPDGSALPRQRALALLRSVVVKPEANVALPGLGDGGVAQVLLEFLSARQAIFILEPDPARIAAHLHLHDWSREFASGRCILVPRDDLAVLTRVLGRYPGLEPPQQIIAPRHVPRTRVEHVTQLLQQATAARPAEPACSSSAPPGATATSAAPRTRVLLICRDPGGPAAAIRRAAAAEPSGELDLRSLDLSTPPTAGPRYLRAAVAGFDAQFTICVGHPPGRLHAKLPGRLAQWHVQRVIDPPAPGDVLHLAASPAIEADLRRHSVPAARIQAAFFAAPPAGDAGASQAPPADALDAADSPILLFADQTDASAAALGINQPTHKLLWQALEQLAAQLWETPAAHAYEELLRRAEQLANAALGELELRTRMLQLIEHRLLPAVEAVQILTRLRTTGRPVEVIPYAAPPADRVPPCAVADPLDPAGRLRPGVAVFTAGSDPLQPLLLAAAVREWPLVLHAPGVRSLTPALAGLLHPGQHYLAFSTARELDGALAQIAAEPAAAAQRARRAREHLQNETYARRIGTLVQSSGT